MEHLESVVAALLPAVTAYRRPVAGLVHLSEDSLYVTGLRRAADNSCSYVSIVKGPRGNIHFAYVLRLDDVVVEGSPRQATLALATRIDNAVSEVEYQWAVYWESDLWC